MTRRPLVLLLISALTSFARAAEPPRAETRPVANTYFGVSVVDPYRYMENLDDPQVQAWFKGQADYSRATLDAVPGRAALFADIQKYENGAPATIGSVSRRPGDLYFFLKTTSDQQVAKLYMRRGLTGRDILLVDTDRLAGPHGEPPAINYFRVSHDGQHVAYGVSQGGSEMAVLHIFDVIANTDMPETIDRAEFGDISWRPDNRSFFYNRLQKLGPNDSQMLKFNKSVCYLHVLGTLPEQDVAVVGMGLSPLVPMTELDDPAVFTQIGCDYAVADIGHGVKLEDACYSAPLSTIGQPNTPWVKICDADAGVTSIEMHGDDLYLLTHKDAPRYQIIRTSLSHPDIAQAQIVIPEGDETISDFAVAADGLYIRAEDGGISRAIYMPWNQAPRPLPLPFEGGVAVFGCTPSLPGGLIGTSSWTRGGRIFSYDPAADKMNPTDLQPAGPYDNLDDITSVEVRVPSYDGTPIPLSIVYRKDIALDGQNPTAVMAYGGYSISLNSDFSPIWLAWVERGGIYVTAHVRGGGEEGEAWHQGAFKLTKPNVWRDLIASCQYLIQKKYTSPPNLAIIGGSNGGITVGRAITERPELFAAAMVRAGVMNVLRFENTPNGPNNVPEYGSVKTQEGFEDLYAMDAYLHVRDGVAYPGVLEYTGMNDPRVSPWMPAKMTARLQAATSSGKSVLLTVDYQGGHGVGMSKDQRDGLYADAFSFFLWQFGDPTFKPSVAGEKLIPDIQYATAGGESLKLDACVPAGTGPFPIAIIVHGGGWSSGDKEHDITPLFDPLSRAHFTWFSINYREAPKNQWPAGFEDLQTAIRWVKAHAAEYKGDANRIALIGESSGGQMICLAAAVAGPDTRVNAVVGYAPPTDMVADTERRGGLSKSAQQLFGMTQFDDRARKVLYDMSPLNFVTAQYPPTLLVHGTIDKSVLYSQSLNFQAKLKSLGVPCDLITITGGVHGMAHWEKLDTSYKGKMIEWLEKTLGE
jgi:prolyl oligopeptidase